MTDLTQLQSDLSAQIAAAPDAAALEAIRVAALGKSGSVSALLKTLGAMSPEERKEKGPAINQLRDAVAAAIAGRKTALETAELDARAAPQAAVGSRVDAVGDRPRTQAQRGDAAPVDRIAKMARGRHEGLL